MEPSSRRFRLASIRFRRTTPQLGHLGHSPMRASGLPWFAALGVGLTLVLGGCGASGPADVQLPSDAPYLRGMITNLEASRIRVEENPSDNSGSAKAVLSVTSRTSILWRSGERATASDLRLGTEVSAWVTGPVMESYPVQGTADVVVIESTTPPGVPAAEQAPSLPSGA